MPKRTVKERFELYNRLVKSLLLAIIAFGGGFAGLVGNYQILSELFGVLAIQIVIVGVAVAIGGLSIAVFLTFDTMRRLNQREKE
jgi:hypothetical protein